MEDLRNEELIPVEEVTEVFEEVSTGGFGNGLKKFGLGVATILIAGIAYKKVVKPMINKIKAQNELAEDIDSEFDDPDFDDMVESEDSEKDI